MVARRRLAALATQAVAVVWMAVVVAAVPRVRHGAVHGQRRHRRPRHKTSLSQTTSEAVAPMVVAIVVPMAAASTRTCVTTASLHRWRALVLTPVAGTLPTGPATPTWTAPLATAEHRRAARRHWSLV